MQASTDEEIAGRVQKGDPRAFAVLVGRYEPKMMRYARRFLLGAEDAEDLVQEVFMKTYINIRGFDTARSFSSWIYRIAHNEFINAIRKKGREPLPFFDPDTLFPHPVAAERADDELKRAELERMMEACLNELKPKYREPLVLYFYENLDYQAIAEVLRVPVSTVGVRIKRGKAALQVAYHKLHLDHP